MPDLVAVSDPERTSHRAFRLRNLEFTENQTEWPYMISVGAAMSMKMDLPELPEPMDSMTASEVLNEKDGDEINEDDERMIAAEQGQLFGQFLLDGVVRWRFMEVPEGGRRMFGAPSREELMTAAEQVV
jgi:hypothetical protein